jgi:hypothetical protein
MTSWHQSTIGLPKDLIRLNYWVFFSYFQQKKPQNQLIYLSYPVPFFGYPLKAGHCYTTMVSGL